MKNFKLFVLAILSIGLFAIASCGTDDEGDPVAPTGPSFTITDITLAATGRVTDTEVVGKVKIVNNTDAVLELMWERADVTVPSGWTTAICDHNLCYGAGIGTRELQLTANQEIELKLNFYPGGNGGSGSTDLTIYEASDKAGTSITKSFVCTVN